MPPPTSSLSPSRTQLQACLVRLSSRTPTLAQLSLSNSSSSTSPAGLLRERRKLRPLEAKPFLTVRALSLRTFTRVTSGESRLTSGVLCSRQMASPRAYRVPWLGRRQGLSRDFASGASCHLCFVGLASGSRSRRCGRAVRSQAAKGSGVRWSVHQIAFRERAGTSISRPLSQYGH